MIISEPIASSSVDALPFADSATTHVVGVPALLAGVLPDSPAARGGALYDRTYTNRAAWEAFKGRIDATEALAQDEERVSRIRAHLAELPDLRGVLAALQDGFEGVEGDFFVLKRFGFHGAAALELLEPLQRVCRRQASGLRTLMQAIHPEDAPSPRFLVSDRLHPDLKSARTAVKRARKDAQDRRAALEGRWPALRFDVHGLAKAPSDFAGGEGLVNEGGFWRVRDEELLAIDARLKSAQQSLDDLHATVLRDLSAHALAAHQLLREAHRFLVQVDVDFARLRLRDAMGGCFPTWGERAEIVDGHALGIPDPQRVSVSLAQGMVVTGPNMGGKSALLRLVGLCQWALQHGMPVPARACELPGVAHLVYVGADLVDETPGLSSFGREVARWVAWWSARDVLWLLDEPGRGTHPEEGAAIAAEVVAARLQLGDRVVAATHFSSLSAIEGVTGVRIAGITDVAALEAAAQGKRDVAVALREAMDYRVVPGDAVPRDARVVARALGLPLKDRT